MSKPDKNKPASDDLGSIFHECCSGRDHPTVDAEGRVNAGAFATCVRVTHDGEANGSSEKD